MRLIDTDLRQIKAAPSLSQELHTVSKSLTSDFGTNGSDTSQSRA